MNLPIIPKLDQEAAQKARCRQQVLTKPLGSLGSLEELSIQLAAMTGTAKPVFSQKGVIVMAADHGIALSGVSAYPREVTSQMVFNFLNGGAAINVISKLAGAKITVVDIGVAYDFQQIEGILHKKIAPGTKNMLEGPAMTRDEAEGAIQVGIDTVLAEIETGIDLVATGEMGIGNTTPSSAITAILTNLPVASVTGYGTGIDDQHLSFKINAIESAIRKNVPNPNDAIDVLAKVGGFEIAGLAGVILGAASRRVPVVVDGFISGAAALIAAHLEPATKDYMIASHQSVEIGHTVIWKHLGLRPILNLGMRLGEGTGAVLSFQVIEAATRLLNEMASFEEAGVSDK